MGMGLLSFEHGKFAERADFVAYGSAVVSLSALLVLRQPPLDAAVITGMVLAGLLGWTLLEYLLHRFVLHRLPPFRRWHAAHHRDPTALIGLPTLVSTTLFATFVLAPAWWALGPWRAAALLLGVLTGYLAYAGTHHAVHRHGARSGWLRRRQHAHALHHGAHGRAAGFGVTTGVWDHVFGTPPVRGAAPSTARSTGEHLARR